MDINISDLLSKSDDELYDFFKGLKRADKFDVWNEISKADIPRIKSFADYLKNIEVTKCVTKGGEKTETVITAFEQIVGPIRSRAIDQAWAKERDLVKKGLGTVNWTEAEQKIIINSRRRPNLPGRYQGHHMCNANTYPHLAGISDNIQFLISSFFQDRLSQEDHSIIGHIGVHLSIQQTISMIRSQAEEWNLILMI